jgi:hypothetical protein
MAILSMMSGPPGGEDEIEKICSTDIIIGSLSWCFKRSLAGKREGKVESLTAL